MPTDMSNADLTNVISRIKTDLTNAMKAGDGVRGLVLRTLLSEFNYKKIAVQHELTDEDILAVLQKEAKKRREAVESFTAGGRAESAAKEQSELKIIEEYLPIMLSEEEIKNEVIKILRDEEIKDFPKAMKLVSPVLKGKADGGVVAGIVKELCN